MKGLNVFSITNKAYQYYFHVFFLMAIICKKRDNVFYIISGSCFKSKIQSYRETNTALLMTPSW